MQQHDRDSKQSREWPRHRTSPALFPHSSPSSLHLVAAITRVNDTDYRPKCFIKLLSSEQLAVSRNRMHTSTKVYESIRCFIPVIMAILKVHTHPLYLWHKKAEDEGGIRPVLFGVLCLLPCHLKLKLRPTPVTNTPWDAAEQNKQSLKWSVAVFKVHISVLCYRDLREIKICPHYTKPSDSCQCHR